jgi:two-component system response regulator PilR (NtrC family)
MPLNMQVKVLRALAERRITPIGDTQEMAVDLRVVAATNRNLETEVKENRFREDLYYRLNVVQIDMPPLRERNEDIPALANHFLERFAKEYGKPLRGFAPDTLAMLRRYPFPGNVRELQNVIERAVALESGTMVTPACLPERVQGPVPVLPGEQEEPFTLEGGLDLEAHLNTIERRCLERAIAATNGNRTQAAKLLGITFRSFRYRLLKYNMDDGDGA